MAHWLNFSDSVRVNALKFPHREALADAHRCFTWTEVNERADRLANAIMAMGLVKGDRVAILLENCVEIIELFIATARTGTVAVPINFRLVADEVRYVTDNSDAKAFFVHDIFLDSLLPVRDRLGKIPAENYVLVGSQKQTGVRDYEAVLADMPPLFPELDVAPSDTWIMLYTSGTTGVPKGVVRSHESYTAFYLINAVDFEFTENDVCLNVMPLCHVNSTYFTLNVMYVGGKVYVHPASGFDAPEVLRIIAEEKVSFISFVPTHYRMLLATGDAGREGLDFSFLKKLLCSSAPATLKMKEEVMEFFAGVDLYEGYGSTEAGIVTVLKPHEQFTKPGSIGRESTGTFPIRILDEHRQPVADGKVGELYSRGPMLFDEYYKMPDITANSFAGEWFTARDMARRDEDGYYFLVDRKDNMIITGGEKVFPSEVEAVLLNHPAIYDAAVIGVSDEKWGEVVTAVVILKPDATTTEEDIVAHCRGKVATFKRPKRAIFISDEEMPRTPTGKILHRQLRVRFGRG
jgi:acyl-CoA synthetase (AMP-forming)/AMP-acid ligase II